MNIAIVIPTLTIGGAERLAIDTAKSLHQQGNKVTLVCLSDASGWVPSDGVQLHIIEQKNKVYGLISYIKKNNVQGCISYLERANFYCSLACWFTGIKYCASVHTAPRAAFANRKFLNRVIIYITYKFISLINAKVICVTQGIKEDLSDLFGINRTRVVNNFIDYETIDNNIESDRAGVREIDYIFVGRLTKVKGCDVLVDALCNMKSYIQDNNIRIVIVGDGIERHNLESRVSASGLGKFIQFMGAKNSPYEFIKISKYLVVPSYAEGFGLVVLEGLYLGCDIIYSKCEFGPREIISKYFPEQISLGFSNPSENREESISELVGLIKLTHVTPPEFSSEECKKNKIKEFFDKKNIAEDIFDFLNE